MEYSSHSFVSLTFDLDLRHAMACVYRHLGSTTNAERQGITEGAEVDIRAKPVLRRADYPFRPEQLEKFPLYFFMAGCEACEVLGPDSMAWVPLFDTTSGVGFDLNTIPLYFKGTVLLCVMCWFHRFFV